MEIPNAKYVVENPETSIDIVKNNNVASLPFNLNRIITPTWAEAYNQLRSKAMQRVLRANEELNNAAAHLEKVMNLKNPDL